MQDQHQKKMAKLTLNQQLAKEQKKSFLGQQCLLINNSVEDQRFQSQKQDIKDRKKQRGQLKRKFHRVNMEIWQDWEIRKIFKLYEAYGSQWKALAREFPQRPCNSIKNRFYTVVRNLLKLVFFEHPQLPTKVPYQISSKIILRFFEGRQEFFSYKNFGKKIIEEIQYNLNSEKIRDIVISCQDQIKEIYQLIFYPQKAESSEKNEGSSNKHQLQMNSRIQQMNFRNFQNQIPIPQNVQFFRALTPNQQYFCSNGPTQQNLLCHNMPVIYFVPAALENPCLFNYPYQWGM